MMPGLTRRSGSSTSNDLASAGREPRPDQDELSDPLDLVGRRIEGKYLVTRVIEQTNLSIVYRATHLIWKRSVAIKVFTAASTLEADERDALIASFVREGALLSELSETCPAICQARDIGSMTTPAGAWMPYLVLEWLDGESLEMLLSRERRCGAPPRTIQQVVRLLGPIADALACAHARGVVHCDVKPGNIMLLRSGQPRCKLLDFGIAKVASDKMANRSAIVERAFTPGFGAPEQFDTAYGQTGPWTDVFALALVVVEMVCGREALQGRGVVCLGQEACDRHRRPTPRALGLTTSDEVERVLGRALAVEPAQRFADARSFWSELLPATATLRAETRAPRRRRWRPAVLVLTIAVAIGFFPSHVGEPRSSVALQATRTTAPALVR